MQINFEPHKIKAAKAYLGNLYGDTPKVKNSIKSIIKKEEKSSLLKKIFTFLFK